MLAGLGHARFAAFLLLLMCPVSSVLPSRPRGRVGLACRWRGPDAGVDGSDPVCFTPSMSRMVYDILCGNSRHRLILSPSARRSAFLLGGSSVSASQRAVLSCRHRAALPVPWVGVGGRTVLSRVQSPHSGHVLATAAPLSDSVFLLPGLRGALTSPIWGL